MSGKQEKRAGNSSSKKSESSRGKLRQDWEDRTRHDTLDSVLGEHSHSGDRPSIEDLAWVGWVVYNGIRSAPLRRSNEELDTKRHEHGLISNAKLNDPSGLLAGILGEDIVKDRKTKHTTASGSVYDVEYDEFIVWPLVGDAGRWVLNPKMKNKAKDMGIISFRKYPFDTQPKRVTKDLYCKIIDMVDMHGGKVRRKVNRQEEKDGVR